MILTRPCLILQFCTTNDKRAARYDLVVSTRLKVAPGLWATHFEQVDGKQVCTKWTSAAKTHTQISSWPKVTMLHGGCMFCETAAFVS
jgi:hypothetical protein